MPNGLASFLPDDQELILAADSETGLRRLEAGYTDDEFAAMIERAKNEFASSPEGLAISGHFHGVPSDEVVAQITTAFHDRYDSGPYPGLILSARLREVARDIVAASLREPAQPKQSAATKTEQQIEADAFAARVAEARNDIHSDSVSTSVIRIKRQSDPVYERAWRIAIGEGAQIPEKPQVSEELTKFAANWNHAVEALGVNSLRAVNGRVNVGRLHYSPAEYERLVTEASEAGLL